MSLGCRKAWGIGNLLYLSIHIYPAMYQRYLVYLAYPCLSSPASSRLSIAEPRGVVWNLSQAESSAKKRPFFQLLVEKRYLFIDKTQAAIIYCRLHLWWRFISWMCVKWPTVAIIPTSTAIKCSSLYHGYTRGNIPVNPGQIIINRSDFMAVHPMASKQENKVAKQTKMIVADSWMDQIFG